MLTCLMSGKSIRYTSNNIYNRNKLYIKILSTRTVNKSCCHLKNLIYCLHSDPCLPLHQPFQESDTSC